MKVTNTLSMLFLVAREELGKPYIGQEMPTCGTVIPDLVRH